jgi:hypothetical protein
MRRFPFGWYSSAILCIRKCPILLTCSQCFSCLLTSKALNTGS